MEGKVCYWKTQTSNKVIALKGKLAMIRYKRCNKMCIIWVTSRSSRTCTLKRRRVHSSKKGTRHFLSTINSQMTNRSMSSETRWISWRYDRTQLEMAQTPLRRGHKASSSRRSSTVAQLRTKLACRFLLTHCSRMDQLSLPSVHRAAMLTILSSISRFDRRTESARGKARFSLSKTQKPCRRPK